MTQQKNIKKITILAMFIALNFIVTSLLRIEGMAPMSSVMNVFAALYLSPFYAVSMAVITALLRIVLLGIPILAFTGSFFGVVLAVIFYKMHQNDYAAIIGEIIGTGIIGAMVSYPAMTLSKVNFNGTLFMYVPRFLAATLIASAISLLLLPKLQHITLVQQLKRLFHDGSDQKLHENAINSINNRK